MIKKYNLDIVMIKNSDKKLKRILFLISFFISVSLFAQVPEKMSYQAVVRDANSDLLVNQLIEMPIFSLYLI